MGVAVGLILIAFGAILTWAVDADANGLNITAVGVILLVVGILVVLLDLLWWRTWTWYAAGPPLAAHDVRARHRTAGQPFSPCSRSRRGGASSSTRTSAARRAASALTKSSSRSA